MPDFSLLFFGAIILIFLIYVVIKIIRSQNIKESIFNILFWILLICSIVYVTFSDNTGDAFLFISSILIILFFSVILLNLLIDFYIVKMCIARALKKIHTAKKLDIDDIFKIKQSFLYTNKVWYIAYSTVNGFTLIGINISKDAPHASKKFSMKALSGENYSADSLNPFNEEDAGKVSILCPLKEFYYSGKENRKIVYDYLLKLKNKKF